MIIDKCKTGTSGLLALLLLAQACLAAGGAAGVTNAPVVAPDAIAVLRAVAGTQTLWGAEAGDTLEDKFNRAVYLLRNERCREALPMLLHLHDTASTAELARVIVDGCSGLFLLHAGLSRVAEALSYQGLHDARAVARAEARLARATPLINARRMGLVLATLSFLPPATPDEFDQTRVTALELYTAAVWQMDHVTRRLAWRLDYMGRTRAALEEYEKLFRRNPRAGSWLYLHAGVLAAWLEDYRRAFQWWHEGLTVAPLTPYHSYGYYRLVQCLRENLPYATLDELLALPRLTRGVAVRYPAEVKETYSIAQWLALSSDTQVIFETTLRLMEERGNAAVSNLWQQGLDTYRHPEYACKLGEHDREAQLYCAQLNAQKRLVRALTLARRIETLAPHMSAATSNQFAQALQHRWLRIVRYRQESGANKDIAGMVDELDRLRSRWKQAQSPPSAPLRLD
jgi:tetratricopeptide (TPR) repeat protein